MSIQVDDISVFDINYIKSSVSSCGEPVISREKHVLFLEDDSVELRVVEGPDFLFALGVLFLEKVESFLLGGYWDHGKRLWGLFCLSK
jgi:hypothetical protein